MLTLTELIRSIVLRTAASYVVILLGLRLAGKREMGQMTVFDLVVLLLISNAVQNAMLGSDTSLVGDLLAAAVLLGLNAAISRLRLRSLRLRCLIEGTPTLLILRAEPSRITCGERASMRKHSRPRCASMVSWC